MEEWIEDARLGTIRFRRNARARRIVFRPSRDGLTATVPLFATRSHVEQAVERLRDRLERMQRQHNDDRWEITPSYCIENEYFDYRAIAVESPAPALRNTPKGLVCEYPPSLDFGNREFQRWLLRHIQDRMTLLARDVLVPRLHELAAGRGLQFAQVRIRKARRQLGSCNSRKHISLNPYLLLLPRHLQDFVMHHELTHLLELNHSPRFYALLDKAVDGKADRYRKELKSTRIQLMYCSAAE